MTSTNAVSIDHRVSAGLPPLDPGRGNEWRAIDLRSVWSAMYRNRFLVVSTIVAFLAIGVLITFLSTPIYKATARIQIDLQAAKILEGSDVEPTAALQDGERYLQTQIDVIKSRGLARQVAEELRLFRGTQFLEAMNVKPTDKPQGVYTVEQARREQVLDVLQKNLKVDLPVDSTVASITFESPDRKLAAQVANAFASKYIVSNLQRKYDTSAYARQFLDQQLQQTRQRLEESERAVIDYARNARLIDTSSGQDSGTPNAGSRSLTTSSLVQLNQSYAQAIANRVAAEQKWREASGTPLMNLNAVLTSPAIQNLVQERARIQSLYDQNSERYRPEYPAQQQAAAQIATLNRQIDRLARNLRDGIRQDYEVARRQQQALEQQLTGLKDSTLAEQDRSVRYNILRRDVDTNRTLYDGLLQRYKEISAAARIASNNVSIVDRADPPIAQVWPRPLLNIAMALLAGLLVGAGLVLLREHFDDAIRSPEDIDRKLGTPMVGLVPALGNKVDPQAELTDKKSELSEAYSALRSALLLSTPNGAPRSLLITSSGPAEGKSTTSYAIAMSFAQIGRRVVLVDSDMRKPAQHRNFGIANTAGLANILASQTNIDGVLQQTSHPELSFIPAGPVPLNPAELIVGPGMSALLDELKRRYDIVIVDGPPVLGLADAPALSAQIDNTLFVLEANRVHGRQAKNALNRLNAAHAKLLGVLLTKFDAKVIGYSTDYGYSYTYGQS
jgi:polysaccharide biosynthesis transport protein